MDVKGLPSDDILKEMVLARAMEQALVLVSAYFGACASRANDELGEMQHACIHHQ